MNLFHLQTFSLDPNCLLAKIKKNPIQLQFEMIAESDFHAVYIFLNYIFFIRAKIRLCHEF